MLTRSIQCMRLVAILLFSAGWLTGCPAPVVELSVASFAINEGAEVASSLTVTLTNECTASPTHYMTSESADFTGAEWQTYDEAPAFKLSSGDGTKTVYFKVKNGSNETAVMSDNITLIAANYVLERRMPDLAWIMLGHPLATVVDDTGHVYTIDNESYTIKKFSPEGVHLDTWGQDGMLFDQPFLPISMALDGHGNLYVADLADQVIKLTSDGEFVTRWGETGAGAGQFNMPFGVAVDSLGNVYVADFSNYRVQKFSSEGYYLGQIDEFGMFAMPLSLPTGVAVDHDNNLYVASNGMFIDKFSPEGEPLASWMVPLDGESFPGIWRIALDNAGGLYALDWWNNCVYTFTSDVTYVDIWIGIGDTGESLMYPGDISTDGGNIYVSDPGSGHIVKMSPDGELLDRWGHNSTDEGKFDKPDGITISDTGDLFVIDGGNGRIQKFSSDGILASVWNPVDLDGGLSSSESDIVVDSAGNFYFADTYNVLFKKYSPTGAYISQWDIIGSSGRPFTRLAIDANDTLFLSCSGVDGVQKYSTEGELLGQWGEAGDATGQFRFPSGIGVDGSGKVYVIEYWSGRIQVFDSEGSFLTHWGMHQDTKEIFLGVSDLTVDQAGSVYASFSGSTKIKKFAANGDYVTQWEVDGTTETQVANLVGDISVDKAGRVYVSDMNNDCILVYRPE